MSYERRAREERRKRIKEGKVGKGNKRNERQEIKERGQGNLVKGSLWKGRKKGCAAEIIKDVKGFCGFNAE